MSENLETESESPRQAVVPDSAAGRRFDAVLAELFPEFSRSKLSEWIKSGDVLLNGEPARGRDPVRGGEVASLTVVLDTQTHAEPEDIPLDILYEDEHVFVINKPVGLVVHPGAGNPSGTLVNALLFRDPGLAVLPRAGIVHRLDKDTSGLMVVARNETAQTHLVRQLQARSMGREYVALAHGWMAAAGRVDRAIGRDPRVPVRMSVERPVAPKPAITNYAPSRRGMADPGGRVTEVVCRLETGRTHQIRVHMASLGHPLLADTIYGGKPIAGAQRQMLHARALHFDDPGGAGEVQFTAAVPADMAQVQESIAWSA